MRLACAIVLVVGLALPAKAQDERGWSFSGSFNGSSNTDGIVMKTVPTLGYTFSSHFQAMPECPFTSSISHRRHQRQERHQRVAGS